MANNTFAHRAVLITGASSGIGRACALEFAARGAKLLLAARRKERLEAVAREVTALGATACAEPCDVTAPTDVERVMRRAEAELGGLDILVNNAGIGLYGPLEAVTEEQLASVFAVNVHGLVRVTRGALPLLRRRGGSQVINISSVLGYRGLPMLGGYCASKAAVNALTESLRLELRPEGIEVLLVSPGLTESEFREVRLHAPGYRQEAIPLKEMPAERVARAVVRASLRRRRETILTLPGRAMVYANRLSPRLFDRVAARMVGPPKP